MKLHLFTISLLIYCTFNSFVICFDVMSIGSTVVAFGSLLYEGAVCKYKECCTKKEIPADFQKLESLLRERIYGQQIAQEVVLNALKAHWSPNTPPSKALTLSFHGWPGGGKNYITGFIVEALYTLGYKSSHVHYFSGRIHFPEESKVPEYQALLYEWIKSNVTRCPKQLFIFDEVNKLPSKLLNILKPIIDYNYNVQKVDYRESIFIFMSNTGQSLITEETLKLYRAGIERKYLALHHFDSLMLRGAFNEQGGFHHSDTIKSNLIDHYIPFLPLEHDHIVECIMDQFRLRQIYNPKKEHIQAVMDFVEWGPAPENLFSKTGCKRISQKVAMEVQKYYVHYNSLNEIKN